MIIGVKYGLFFVLTKISFDTKLSNLQCSAKQLTYGIHKPLSQWKCLHALFFNHIVEESMTGKIKKHYFWARVKKYIFHKLYVDFYTVHVSLNKDKNNEYEMLLEIDWMYPGHLWSAEICLYMCLCMYACMFECTLVSVILAKHRILPSSLSRLLHFLLENGIFPLFSVLFLSINKHILHSATV